MALQRARVVSLLSRAVAGSLTESILSNRSHKPRHEAHRKAVREIFTLDLRRRGLETRLRFG
jgi:hypothetical protein